VLKGTFSQSADEVKSKMAGLLKGVLADNLQHCFDQWKILIQQIIDKG
jgi:hypothetical protein